MILFVTTLITISMCSSYIDIDHQDTYFTNLHANNYILAVFHNPKNNSKLTKHLKAVLQLLDESKIIKEHKIVVEFVDTVKLPFFDSHYDLEGKNAMMLFIRDQMINVEDFVFNLEQVYRNSMTESELITKLEDFVSEKINNISIEVLSIQHFRDLILSKRILGLYSGSKNTNFNIYFHIARKNIDFNFAHTFDPQLKEIIFKELEVASVPETDAFFIIRHSEELNDFDNQMVVTTTDFDEKNLSEFIEYNRFNKLRGPEEGNEIFKRMTQKYQPLVLFVKNSSENSDKFRIFKESVQALPKKLIYSYVEIDSNYIGSFIQIFMIENAPMNPNNIYFMWMTPMRTFKIEQYGGNYNRQDIMNFVMKSYDECERTLSFVRSHLYDYKGDDRNAQLITEEL